MLKLIISSAVYIIKYKFRNINRQKKIFQKKNENSIDKNNFSDIIFIVHER